MLICEVCQQAINITELKTIMVLNPITAKLEKKSYHHKCYYDDFTKLEISKEITK